MTKAVILFSGGLDSTVMLAIALKERKNCFLLSFSYGQTHIIELEAAAQIAHHYDVPHTTIEIKFPWGKHSSLTSSIEAPSGRSLDLIAKSGIPTSYVPARNTLFISYAIGFAELLDAHEIHIGCNALDQTNYPDCKSEYLQAFREVLKYATKQAVEGLPPKLITPLEQLDKIQIMQLAKELQVPIDMTWSCYKPQNKTPCLVCDACVLRKSAIA